MVHWFNNFFCQKILNIHDGFPFSTSSQDVPLVEAAVYKSTMDTISIRATDTVAKWLVKERQDVLIIPITKLVNTS